MSVQDAILAGENDLSEQVLQENQVQTQTEAQSENGERSVQNSQNQEDTLESVSQTDQNAVQLETGIIRICSVDNDCQRGGKSSTLIIIIIQI